MSALRVPELNESEFLTACVEQHCLLTLYAYTIQQSTTPNITKAFQQLQAVAVWHSNIKIRSIITVHHIY